MWIEVLELVAIVIGVGFMAVASIGVLRLPEFYMRAHAPTKAATLGLLFLFVALALDVQDRAVVTKAILAMLFIGATAPVGAHLLARAAVRRGIASRGAAPPADLVRRAMFGPGTGAPSMLPAPERDSGADEDRPTQGPSLV